jgi:hypothetical protein
MIARVLAAPLCPYLRWERRSETIGLLFSCPFLVLTVARLRTSFRSTVPETGGHTNFRNAGVHVRPESGNAIFFSYIDPQKLIMDTGFTEHSGCPVYEGEKKIVTQWIRLGVDHENPWDSFNTCKSIGSVWSLQRWGRFSCCVSKVWYPSWDFGFAF